MDPSILFVIGLVIALVLGVIGSAFGNWLLMGLAVLILGGSVWLYAGPVLLTFSVENWPYILSGLGIYVGVGVLYSLFRHWRWVNSEQVQAQIQQGIKDWRAANTMRANDGAPLLSFKDTLYYPRDVLPDRANIITWAAFWPVSIIFYFLGDVLRDLFIGIYNRIVGVFTAISDRAVRRAGGE